MVKQRSRKSPRVAARGRVKPHDPFELIRWLAYSQPDPRKALAELVQNSLDAGAARVRIVRIRERGVACLRVWDDGEGVIPSLYRVEALKHIATNIGHSRKRNLSPQERLQLMTQGQYGIGLLGFWSLGERLEMRSSVPGQVPHKLVLHRDDPAYEVEPLRGKLDLDERYTEVVIVGVNPAAQSALAGRRAADYLSAELRGQLLARNIDIHYEDRMARGTAQKSVPIRPVRFAGERLGGFDLLIVPEHAPIRLELYTAAPGDTADEESRLAVYAAGTLVAESFDELGGLGLNRAPWADRRLRGFVDFPDLTVAPGSRRGIVVDETAQRFANALAGIEAQVQAALDALELLRSRDLDRSLLRDLRRAFHELLRAKPRYQLPHAPAEGRAPGAPAEQLDDDDVAGGGDATDRAQQGDEVAAPLPPRPVDTQLLLLPPGPLQQLRLVPSRARVAVLSSRTLRAEPLDLAGRPCAGAVEFDWYLDGLGSSRLEPAPDGTTATLHTAEELTSGFVRVIATQDLTRVDATAEITIVESLDRGDSLEGIPAPVLIEDTHGAWRSRWLEERWEVNAGHADYMASTGTSTLRLRYLALLFAKEVVLKSAGDPRLERPLEQLIEVFAFADRRLSKPGRRGSSAD